MPVVSICSLKHHMESLDDKADPTTLTFNRDFDLHTSKVPL